MTFEGKYNRLTAAFLRRTLNARRAWNRAFLGPDRKPPTETAVPSRFVLHSLKVRTFCGKKTRSTTDA